MMALTKSHPLRSNGLVRLPSATTALGAQNLVICTLVVVSSLDVCAQSSTTGALMGTVTDPSGAVLQNAQIGLRKTGTGESRTTVTDQDGSYRFVLLSPGEYELTVEAIEFAPVVVRVPIRITEVMSLT